MERFSTLTDCRKYADIDTLEPWVGMDYGFPRSVHTNPAF